MRKIFYSPMLVRDHVDQALHFSAGIRIPSVLRRWRIRSMSFSCALNMSRNSRKWASVSGCPSGSSCRGCAASRFSSALFITSCQNWSSSICDGGDHGLTKKMKCSTCSSRVWLEGIWEVFTELAQAYFYGVRLSLNWISVRVTGEGCG